MANILLDGKSYDCDGDDTLLDQLRLQGAHLTWSCRSGNCLACKLKLLRGDLPADVREGLPRRLRDLGYILACRCRPEGDLELASADRRDELAPSRILFIEHLNESVLLVGCERPDDYHFLGGQFATLMRAEDGVARSFSLASGADDDCLRFHIRVLPEGQFSGWLAEPGRVGERLLLSEPMGSCCYRPELVGRPLLLAGTGTGLAPLCGVLNDALAADHDAPIVLIHGVRGVGDLYFHSQLSELAARHARLDYRPSVMDQGRIETRVAEALAEGPGWECFLCGGNHSVRVMRETCLGAGVHSAAIHADSFG